MTGAARMAPAEPSSVGLVPEGPEVVTRLQARLAQQDALVEELVAGGRKAAPGAIDRIDETGVSRRADVLEGDPHREIPAPIAVEVAGLEREAEAVAVLCRAPAQVALVEE